MLAAKPIPSMTGRPADIRVNAKVDPSPVTDSPPGNAAAAGGTTSGERGKQSVGDFPDSTAESAAARFRNAYAVLVRGKSVRRHLYLNLPAAERVVRRALDRGAAADMVLVRLVPVNAAEVAMSDE